MIHRAPGAIERFFAIPFEHYAGAFACMDRPGAGVLGVPVVITAPEYLRGGIWTCLTKALSVMSLMLPTFWQENQCVENRKSRSS